VLLTAMVGRLLAVPPTSIFVALGCDVKLVGTALTRRFRQNYGVNERFVCASRNGRGATDHLQETRRE
jgi:hypothetical protein